MVTLLEGLRAGFPDSRLLHAPGVPVEEKDASGIPAALAAARDSDLVILCLGEGRWMSGEAGSRAHPDLPGLQPELARAVLDLGKPVVVLLSSGRPVLASWLYERADATLACWFLGSEAGHAVADVLSGRHNPTARLPVTWPVEVGQIPIHYDQLPTGRPYDPGFRYSGKYLDCPNEPLFPFGHGLCYGRFAYGCLRASPADLAAGDACTVEVEVTNEGSVAGEETVLLFVNDPVASLSRPVLELKGVAKLRLAPGERGVARFGLTTADLAFVGSDLASRLEPGAFDLYVGPSADRSRLVKTRIHLREG
jgi:beta-glucosidase